MDENFYPAIAVSSTAPKGGQRMYRYTCVGGRGI